MTRARSQEGGSVATLAGPRIERIMNVVRWTASGIVFGVGPSLPSVGADWVIGLGAYFFILSALLTIFGRRLQDPRGRSLVSHLALAGDALGGMGALVVFSPGPDWVVAIPVGVVLIGTGALRGGVGGAFATLVATAIAYIAGEANQYDLRNRVELTRLILTLAAFAFTAIVFVGWHGEVRRLLGDRARVAALLTLVQRVTTDVIYEWDIATGALTLSESAATQLGYSDAHRRVDRSWWEERLHPEDSGPVKDQLATLLRTGGHEWEVDYRFRKADGSYTTVHDRAYVVLGTGRKRRPVRMVGSLVNVDSVSLYDRVTHLAGRALFFDRVERRVAGIVGVGEPFAVIVTDIENARELFTSLGPQRADALMAELARRLEELIREREIIARIGQDQIGMLVRAKDGEEAVARAAIIRDAARLPFGESGDVRIDVVIGVAILPEGEDAPDLIRVASAALADAKRARQHVALYEPGAEQRWDQRLELRDDLRGAIERHELSLSFQPIADAYSGRCAALEAFVRWQHPELGELDAADLLPVASDLELRARIDRWVIQEAIRSISKLRHAVPELRVSVNVSPPALDDDFVTSLRVWLAAAMLPGDALTLEVPEDPALESGAPAAALAAIRELRVGVAIDDFGTGYASLLRTAVPASEVKIDRVFVSRIAADDHAYRVVGQAIVRAHERGMTAVAEGVEDDATVEALRELRIDNIQGHLVARPMPYDAVAHWLAPAVAEPLRQATWARPEAADRRTEDVRETAIREPIRWGAS